MTKSNQVNDLSFRLHVEDQTKRCGCRSLQTQALAANSLQMLDLLVVCVMIYYTHGSPQADLRLLSAFISFIFNNLRDFEKFLRFGHEKRTIFVVINVPSVSTEVMSRCDCSQLIDYTTLASCLTVSVLDSHVSHCACRGLRLRISG